MKKTKLLGIIAMTFVLAQASIGFAEAPALLVDGEKIDAEIIVKNDMKMLPLRAMAENMGYTVGWNAEEGVATVTKENDEFFVQPNKARSAEYMAEIINDRTYVSLDFVKVTMDMDYVEDESGNVNILTAHESESLVRKVTINEILEDRISVNDELQGEVIVMISEETKISKAGEEIKLSDIAKEDTLLVEYGPAMTMSLPPQTTAVSIEVVVDEEEGSEISEDAVTYEGKISEITEDGMVIVTTDEDKIGVALKISENTQISHVMNRRLYKAEDLEVGMDIVAQHSNIMTRSLPPQTEAFSIIIK